MEQYNSDVKELESTLSRLDTQADDEYIARQLLDAKQRIGFLKSLSLTAEDVNSKEAQDLITSLKKLVNNIESQIGANNQQPRSTQ